jgi:hypothetical protein
MAYAERSLDAPEAKHDVTSILAERAREDFDEGGNNPGAVHAYRWLCDKTIDCVPEIRAVVMAAVNFDRLRFSDQYKSDAHAELVRAVDALRELYIEGREWTEWDIRDAETGELDED